MSINRKVREQIKKAISDAAAQCGFALPDFIIEVPKNKDNGDFSANAAMLMSKQAHMAPRDIAAKLCGAMQTQNTYIKEVKVAGPGFLNFYLSDDRLYDVIDEVEEKGGTWAMPEAAPWATLWRRF